MQQDGCIAESGVCLAFSKNTASARKQLENVLKNTSCFSILENSSLLFFTNFSPRVASERAKSRHKVMTDFNSITVSCFHDL